MKKEEKNKVGRPKLADEKQKKNAIIHIVLCILLVIFLSIYGIATLFGSKLSFKRLKGNALETNEIETYSVVSSGTDPNKCKVRLLNLDGNSLKYQIICAANAKPTGSIKLVNNGKIKKIALMTNANKGYIKTRTYKTKENIDENAYLSVTYRKYTKDNEMVRKYYINKYYIYKNGTLNTSSEAKVSDDNLINSNKCKLEIVDTYIENLKYNVSCSTNAKVNSIRLVKTSKELDGSEVKIIDNENIDEFGASFTDQIKTDKLRLNTKYRLVLYYGIKNKDYYRTTVDFKPSEKSIITKSTTKKATTTTVKKTTTTTKPTTKKTTTTTKKTTTTTKPTTKKTTTTTKKTTTKPTTKKTTTTTKKTTTKPTTKKTTTTAQKTTTTTRPTTTTKVSVASVKLDKTNITINKGKTATIKATVSPANANNKTVSYKSSDTSVATVDSSGKITAKKKGTAKITVTTNDGNKTATCNVTVNVPVSGVKFSKSSITLLKGKKFTLVPTVSPSDASNKSVSYKSSNTSVATVDSNGVVVAKNRGTATITVTTKDGSKTSTIKVIVNVPVSGVKFSKSSITLLKGKKFTLVPTVSPSDASNKSVSYKSSNTSVATVDSNGVVVAKNRGTATITVTTKDGSKTSTIKVIVEEEGTCGIDTSNGKLQITSSKVTYNTKCTNDAVIKNLYYKIGNSTYKKLPNVKTGTISYVDSIYSKKITFKFEITKTKSQTKIVTLEKTIGSSPKISANKGVTTGYLKSPLNPSDSNSKAISRVGKNSKTLYYKSGNYHGGTDFPVSVGSKVYAMDGGVIFRTKNSGSSGYGKSIIIKHYKNKKTYYTVYGHLNKVGVKTGEHVAQGQFIGESGNTGNSSGPHLHAELINKPCFGHTCSGVHYLVLKYIGLDKTYVGQKCDGKGC